MSSAINLERMLAFSQLPTFVPIINEENYNYLVAREPKRKRFCDCSVDPIKESGNFCYINLKFTDSVGPILASCLGGDCIPNQFGYAVKISKDKKEKARKLLDDIGHIVFIRSLFSCSIAMDMNYVTGKDEYTVIGYHEHLAKEKDNKESIEKLKIWASDIVRFLPIYKHADAVVCVPPSSGRYTSLPKIIAQNVAISTEKLDFTGKLSFINKQSSLQSVNRDKKWKTLNSSGFVVDDVDNELQGKVVILIDDLYQSGTTMHFVGQQLQNAGVQHILGLSLVKSRRDTDNS